MGRAEERTNYILDRLAREGEVSVAQLASDLGVSPVTVRASLKVLDEQGYLVRTHGGARPTTFRNIHLRPDRQVPHRQARSPGPDQLRPRLRQRPLQPEPEHHADGWAFPRRVRVPRGAGRRARHQ